MCNIYEKHYVHDYSNINGVNIILNKLLYIAVHSNHSFFLYVICQQHNS